MMTLQKCCNKIVDVLRIIILVISISYIVFFVCDASIKSILHINIKNYPENIDYGVLSEEQINTFNEILDAVENGRSSVNCPVYSAKEQHEISTQLGLYYGTTEKIERLIYWGWYENCAPLNLKMFKELEYQKIIIDARVDEAVSTLIEGPDRYKLWQISNYISRKITYTDGYRDTMTALNGQGVCSSYAMLFYKMATRVGIKAYICYGYAGEEYHAWNVVELDGECVHYDVTWYDNIIHDIRYINRKSSWNRKFQINNKWSIDLSLL